MDRLSKVDRKAALAAWKARERAKAQSEFPLPDATLEQFFALLEARLESVACKHDTVEAERVIESLGLRSADSRRLLEWCEDNGGFCDCEIVLNTIGHWQENRRAAS